MLSRTIVLVSVFFTCIVLTNCKAQSFDLTFPEKDHLSKSFLNKIKEQKDRYYNIYKKDTAKIKNYEKEFVFSKLDTSKNYLNLRKVRYWIAFHYEEGIPELIKRITNVKK